IEDDVDGNGARLQQFATHYFVEIEGDALAVTHRVHHHERLTHAQLHDIARRKKVRVTETSEAVNLDGAAIGLELVRQPLERRTLSDGNDDVIDVEALGRNIAIHGDRRGIDGPRKPRRMQLQGLNFAIAEHGGHGATVNQLHAFFEHVVEIFRRGGHLLRSVLDGDHGHFDGALPQGFAGAVDGGVSAANDGNASAQLDFRRAHTNVAKERKAIMHAVFVFALSAHTVRLGEADGENHGVVVLFQIVPGNVLADFDVGLDGDAELDQALDLAIEHVLREHPVGNAAAIESAGFRRLFENRNFVAEARQLIGRAVTGGTRADDGNFFAVGLAGLDHIVGQRLS